MAVTVEVNHRGAAAPPARAIRIGDRVVPVVGPKIRDPRIHLAITTFTILTIGMVWLDFRLSIPQVAVALLTCGLLEIVRTYRANGTLAWPASALQTATSTALILRVAGFEAHQWWSFEGWYYFAAVAAAGVLTKYYIRYQGRHIFNPSNIALVVAFVVLGSDRIEPLDFWWGPFGWAMLAAYVVIIVGGVSLCHRLGLLGMALGFYATFAVGVAVLAVLGQSITTQWSLMPIAGAHYWWILVTSPETLIFLFFMITDPRTTPAGRTGRIAFGCAVAMASTVLLAPWETEFGTKVGLLSGLLVVTAARPFVEHWHAVREARTPIEVDTVSRARRDARPGSRRALTAAAAILGIAGFVAVAAVAGAPNRRAAEAQPPPPTATSDIDPAALPEVAIDDNVAGLSAELATSKGARELAAALAFNLQVEAEAMTTRDPSLLPAVDHGRRLDALQSAIDKAAGTDIVVPTYHFDTLHLSIVYPGGAQSGANAGMAATGTVEMVTYAPNGDQIGSREEPFDTLFSLRQVVPGRWFTTDTPPPAAGD